MFATDHNDFRKAGERENGKQTPLSLFFTRLRRDGENLDAIALAFFEFCANGHFRIIARSRKFGNQRHGDISQ
jgi:hypothetical protein